jgi:hypothetical protein
VTGGQLDRGGNAAAEARWERRALVGGWVGL